MAYELLGELAEQQIPDEWKLRKSERALYHDVVTAGFRLSEALQRRKEAGRGVAPSTARNLLLAIYDKSDIHNRPQLAWWTMNAVASGIGNTTMKAITRHTMAPDERVFWGNLQTGAADPDTLKRLRQAMMSDEFDAKEPANQWPAARNFVSFSRNFNRMYQRVSDEKLVVHSLFRALRTPHIGEALVPDVDERWSIIDDLAPDTITPKQLAAVATYVEQGGSKPAASVMGVAVNTVKNHLTTANELMGTHFASVTPSIDSFYEMVKLGLIVPTGMADTESASLVQHTS